MEFTEYSEKKKELEEAEEKVKRYKQELRGEKRRKLRGILDKINFFHNLKPWTKGNILLIVIMIILFFIAYNHNDSSDINDNKKGFLDGIFGFFDNKDKTIESENNNIEEDIPEEDNTSSDSVISSNVVLLNISDDSDEGEDTEPVNFNMWAEYNEEQFSTITTSLDNLVYYLVVENNEGFDIKCEGDDYKDEVKGSHSNFIVQSNDQRSVFNRVFLNEAGTDKKLNVKHELTCYDADKSISDGSKKQATITITFNI